MASAPPDAIVNAMSSKSRKLWPLVVASASFLSVIAADRARLNLRQRLPTSVSGEADRSGFSRSTGTLGGPLMGAPGYRAVLVMRACRLVRCFNARRVLLQAIVTR